VRQDAPATDAMTASAISMERATAGLPLQFQVGVGPALLLERGGWNLGQRDQLADEPVVIRANEIRSPLEGGSVRRQVRTAFLSVDCTSLLQRTAARVWRQVT
jgi:hypothetical protein